jgi:hypothetical protein
MSRFLFGLGVGISAIALAAGVQEGAIAQPDPIFRSIASSLKDQLPQGWKLRLPSSIQVRDYENKSVTLYAKSDGFNNGSLRVSLDTQSGCTVRACQMGSIFVERGSSFLGHLKSDPIFTKSNLERVRSVRSRNYETWTDADRQLMLQAEGAVLERSTVDLDTQIKGTFVYRNGMGVSTGSSIIVTWNQDGQIYTISLRGGLNNKQAIVEAAKSMAKEGPIGESEVAEERPNNPPSDGYSEKEFVQAWSSANPALKPFLGTWLEPEGNIRIYPATVKDRVCLVVNTSGEMIVDVGTVMNGQITNLSEGGGPYISRRGKPGERSWTGQPETKELLVSVNPRGNLVAWRFLNRDTTSIQLQHPSQGLQGLPQEILRGRSAEIQKFDRAGCTTGLPEGSIAQPTTPLQPIAAASTYAYPSPAEFTQFKKTLKPSPVALSTTDRKLRQDFQAEWQKKNRAIAPYVGAWKTADNQDVYVFPSTVSQRACVVRQKDGQLEMKLAVSMTADMRFDGNTGMFRVDPMTDVVAGRSDKSEPLSALYGAIGSPDVSSVKGELEQAQCISELPKGIVVAKKDEVVKPIETLSQTETGTGNPVNFDKCEKGKLGDYYKSTRELLAKCLSRNTWDKPKISDQRIKLGNLLSPSVIMKRKGHQIQNQP